MASWNPTPTLGGANWYGNPPIVTKNQLFSTSQGLYNDIQDISGLNLQGLSTLTLSEWLSAPLIYVSDIQGYNVYITQDLSANTGVFNITNVSIMQFTFKPTFTGNVEVSFDLGLGQAIGGFLGGLGAAVGGALIGLGTGVGLIVQGAEQGIATMVAGRPQNFITSNTYETINFTSQLQVSTLGDAYPVYSSIFRTVSSVSANQVPGREIFTSSFFYPGQICVRTASDPINLITGNSNLNTSTIQSFGQWVPLQGLEPDNIIANSISTNFLSTGLLFAEKATLNILENTQILTNYLQIGEFPVGPQLASMQMSYEAPLIFQLGAVNFARLLGDLNYFYIQSDEDILFTKTGNTNTIPTNASLSLGSNANESILTVSTINVTNVLAQTGNFSSLTVTTLTVISSINEVFSTTAVSVLSTSGVTANFIQANFAQISSIAPFQFFSTVLGNSNGPYDINRIDSVVSTTYDSISSLTQNILSYSLNAQVQNEATFNIQGLPPASLYSVTPQNVSQWGSTILIFNDYKNPGQIDLGWVGQWSAAPGDSDLSLTNGATFDVLYTSSNAVGKAANFYITEQSNNTSPPGISTFYQYVNSQGFVGNYTARLTLPPIIGGTRTGWWQLQTPSPPPYITMNNNTLTISQDINDTYIKGTDRLHIQAGDILFDGRVNLSNFTVTNLNAQTITSQNAFLSTVSASVINVSTINASNILVNPFTGGIDTYYYKSTVSYNAAPTSLTPIQFTFITDSPDYTPIYNLYPAFIGANYFTQQNLNQWNNTQWNNVTPFSVGGTTVYVGNVQQQSGTYSGRFWINNTITAPYALSIYRITAAGSNLLGTLSGGQYGLIQTTNGTNWTLTCNVPNPQGISKNSYNNTFNLVQSQQDTTITNTLPLNINSPTINFTTGTMFMYADQLRVNSRMYGNFEATGLPSYPIGIENNVYIDSNISWTYVPAQGYWQSDANNILYNLTGDIFYDANSWIIQIIPSRFRTNNSLIVSWDVQPAIFPVGGGGYAWGYSRYILVSATVGGPGIGANNWNWYIAFPLNYCTTI